MDSQDLKLLGKAIDEAKRLGATACDLFAVSAETLETQVRDGRIEKLHRAESRPVGLRVFLGNRSGLAASSDWSAEGLSDLAANAVRLARLMQEDAAAGLPKESPSLPSLPDDAADPKARGFSPEEAMALAKSLEAAALAMDPRVKTTGGTGFAAFRQRVYYLDSRGRAGTYPQSYFSLWTSPVAFEETGAMQTGHWHHTATTFAKLESPEMVAREAVRRTVRRLGARKIASGRVPVIFEAEAAGSLLGHLAGAILGPSLYMKSSFLLESLEKRIFPAGIEILDDPGLAGGLASRPFDGEGMPTAKRAVVEDGVLKSFLLDSYAARRLGSTGTASAGRSPEGAPSASTSNLYMKAGTRTPREIVLSVKRGFYVTELLGMGVNPVTGDYSKGAVGLWIEGGEFAHPVQEMTISGNLKGMFQGIQAVGNDLALRGSIAAPTLLVDEMTLAGT